jgi:hypothetical protein
MFHHVLDKVPCLHFELGQLEAGLAVGVLTGTYLELPIEDEAEGLIESDQVFRRALEDDRAAKKQEDDQEEERDDTDTYMQTIFARLDCSRVEQQSHIHTGIQAHLGPTTRLPGAWGSPGAGST